VWSCHRARRAGSVGSREDRGERPVEAQLKGLRMLQQPTQIDHKVSVVLPYDGEKLTFCGVDGVRRWPSGPRFVVRVSCDTAHDTNPPTWACFELLGDRGLAQH